MKKKQLILSSGVLVVLAMFLGSCFTPPPQQPDNICSIFKQYPNWYLDALKTQQKWGVPIPIQMAIINQESSFRPTVEARPSTSVGYCQAVIHTWDCYEQSVGKDESRDQFAASTNFIGWYAHLANTMAGIQPTDAYNLYLAYNQGIGAYRSKSFRWKHPWAFRLARKVAARAEIYAEQLKECQDILPKPSVVSFQRFTP